VKSTQNSQIVKNGVAFKKTVEIKKNCAKNDCNNVDTNVLALVY